jgi:hypothetical protein
MHICVYICISIYKYTWRFCRVSAVVKRLRCAPIARGPSLCAKKSVFVLALLQCLYSLYCAPIARGPSLCRREVALLQLKLNRISRYTAETTTAAQRRRFTTAETTTAAQRSRFTTAETRQNLQVYIHKKKWLYYTRNCYSSAKKSLYYSRNSAEFPGIYI